MQKTSQQHNRPSAFRLWRTLSVAFLFVAGIVLLLAQDAPKPQEPDYANSFFYLNSSGALQPLERKPVGVQGRIKALGYGGAETDYQVLGERSPVRFPAGKPIEIVVKLENHDVDPATLIVLYPLKPGKGKRQLLISGQAIFGLHAKSDLQSKQQQMTFAKYGQASLKITPAAPLPPGEYAIAVQNRDQQPTAWCFGIDAAQ
jgi:hypothetical protein